MAIMVAETYDALRDAGASGQKARKAAGVVAASSDGYPIGKRFDALQIRMARLEGELALLRWRVGTVGAMTPDILVKLFIP